MIQSCLGLRVESRGWRGGRVVQDLRRHMAQASAAPSKEKNTYFFRNVCLLLCIFQFKRGTQCISSFEINSATWSIGRVSCSSATLHSLPATLDHLPLRGGMVFWGVQKKLLKQMLNEAA